MRHRIRRFILGAIIVGAPGCSRPGEMSPAAGNTADTVRILAYNIHHGAGMDEVLDLQRIAALISEVNPDLVALQEIDSATTRTDEVDQAARLGRLTQMTAVFGGFMPYRGGAYGMAVLSRWPIEESHNYRLPVGTEPRTAVSITVTSPRTGRSLRFVGIHFYETEEERLAQAVRLEEYLAEDELPTILAGDFNSTPGSVVMDHLANSWGIVDKGDDHFTFPSFGPIKEIDFVLLQPADRFTVLSQRVITEPVASDHRPVFVELILRD